MSILDRFIDKCVCVLLGSKLDSPDIETFKQWTKELCKTYENEIETNIAFNARFRIACLLMVKLRHIVYYYSFYQPMTCKEMCLTVSTYNPEVKRCKNAENIPFCLQFKNDYITTQDSTMLYLEDYEEFQELMELFYESLDYKTVNDILNLPLDECGKYDKVRSHKCLLKRYNVTKEYHLNVIYDVYGRLYSVSFKKTHENEEENEKDGPVSLYDATSCSHNYRGKDFAYTYVVANNPILCKNKHHLKELSRKLKNCEMKLRQIIDEEKRYYIDMRELYMDDYMDDYKEFNNSDSFFKYELTWPMIDYDCKMGACICKRLLERFTYKCAFERTLHLANQKYDIRINLHQNVESCQEYIHLLEKLMHVVYVKQCECYGSPCSFENRSDKHFEKVKRCNARLHEKEKMIEFRSKSNMYMVMCELRYTPTTNTFVGGVGYLEAKDDFEGRLAGFTQ